MNQVFEESAAKQYVRSLLFSEVVDVMGSVLCQVFPCVDAAYQ